MKAHDYENDESAHTSVKELRQWLSQFGEKHKEHLRKGMVVRKAPKDLSISYELQRSKQRLCESTSISSTSTHSTSVASPPVPFRTVSRVNGEPSFDVATSKVRSKCRPSMVRDETSADVTFSESDTGVKWYASKTSENECIRILAKVDSTARPHTADAGSSNFVDTIDSKEASLPSNPEQEDKYLSAHRVIREKVPLLFCKSRRKGNDTLDPSCGLSTVTVPNVEQTMSRHSEEPHSCPAPPLTATILSETSSDDSSFQFDDYWNESNCHRLSQASPSIQEISTSLVHVFEKEIQVEGLEQHSFPELVEDDDTVGYNQLKPMSLLRRSEPSIYDSPSKSDSYDTASSSISSKFSELKTVTPPRTAITEKIERFGGRVKAKRLSSIQERMAELESKWSKHKQEEQLKAVKWEARNGTYKRRVLLQTKGPSVDHTSKQL